MTRSIMCVLLLSAVLSNQQAVASGPPDSLRTAIARILEHAPGKVGVAVLGLEQDDTLTFNGDDRFPMQSVFKFPLALAVLHQVDAGTMSLDQLVHIGSDDLLPNTWSPLKEKYPAGNVDITLRDLLTFTVAHSDNNGCDILFRLVGGPHAVENYVRALGITQMAIATTEADMHKDGKAQYRNWCSPAAMARLLAEFHRKKLLSTATQDYLMQTMVNTTTGTKKIKGLLPAAAVIAHKTGSSGTDEEGLTAASNDVGIMTLPDGAHVAIAVFVTDAKADESMCEAIIARIARAVWDAHTPP